LDGLVKGRMMANEIRVGFAGVGWMGEQLLRRLHENPRSEVVAVYDVNRERTGSILEQVGLSGAIMVDSFDALVNDDEINTVFVASPNTFHGRQAISAMEGGKHVFCEKPAATDFGEFVREVELDEANPQLATMVDYILLFDPMENLLHDMITGGAFGQITQIQINYRHPVNIAGDKTWKLRKEIVGDGIGMGPIHAIFSILWHMGPAKPVSVYATCMEARVRGFEVPPVWNILIEFDTGATGIIQGNIDNGNRYDAYHNIYGTKGGFVFDSQTEQDVKVKYWSEERTDGRWVFPLSRTIAERDGTTEHLWDEDLRMPDSGDVIHHQTTECVGHFIDSIVEGSKSPLSFSRSAAVAEVGFAALMSAGKKSPISMPLDRTEAGEFFSGA